MIRPMTSDVAALSGIVANGHQAIHFVSSAPSKIPYGGFSPVRLQTSGRNATFGGAPAPPYSRFQSSSGIHPLCWSGCLGSSPHPNVPNAESDVLVQWPLAPPAVVLSASLVAYYGHIRASGGHRRFRFLCRRLRDLQKFPNLLRQGLIPCRRLYSGGSRAPLMSRSVGLGLHPFCRGSATTLFHTPDYVWSHLRSCSVDLMLRPGILLAPLWTGRLRPSLRAVDRSSARRLSLHELSSHS
jgi:hypothetical protein